MNTFAKPPVVILCGGLGLRLRSVIADRPKCLAPIADRPFLDYLLGSLEAQGFGRIILCLGYGAEQVLDFVQRRRQGIAIITHVLEKSALGTGGALKNAESAIETDSFVAMNGDTILELKLNQIIDFHRQKGARATLGLWRTPDAADRYGTVRIAQDGSIDGFTEKSRNADSCRRSPCLINGGVYVFSTTVFQMIPSAPPPVSLETQVFPSLIGNGLFGFPSGGYFLDIGVPADYERAQIELPERFK